MKPKNTTLRLPKKKPIRTSYHNHSAYDEEEDAPKGSIFIGLLWAGFCILAGRFTGGHFKDPFFGMAVGLIAGFIVAGKSQGGRGVVGAIIATIIVAAPIFCGDLVRDFNKGVREAEERMMERGEVPGRRVK